MKRYLTGVDWVVNAIDYTSKAQSGIGNHSEIILELNNSLSHKALTETLNNFIQKFSCLNGGFGMVLDGSKDASRRLQSMLFWDVNNGISRRSWARNDEALFAIKRAMATQPLLKVTIPNLVDDAILENL